MVRAPRKTAAAAGTKPAAVPPAAPAAPVAEPVIVASDDPVPAAPAEQAAAIGATIEDMLANAKLADASDGDDDLGGFDMGGRTILVRSVAQGGRRRAGLAFGPVPVPVAVDDLTEDQLAAILADSDHLVVALDS